jgi:hypothetical protein
MPEPLTVYNLGEKGVDLVSTPYHIEDGALTQGQNAEFYREQGRSALRKRPALRQHNTNVLAGTIGGLIQVPLPATRTVYVNVAGNPFFRSSTNGTTWANVSPAPKAPADTGITYSLYPILKFAMARGQFFYTAQTGGSPSYDLIIGYNGTDYYELVRFDEDAYVRILGQHAGSLIVTAVNNSSNVVYLVDIATGTKTRIGGAGIALTTQFMCGVSYQGKIWVGAASASTGLIYSTYPTDSDTWTLERTAAAGHKQYQALTVYNGELFAGTAVYVAGTAAIVEKRTADGTWSTSRTGSDTGEFNRYDGFVTFDGDLYAAYQNSAGTTVAIETYDGASWSVDKDLDAVSVTQVTGALSVGVSAIYYSGFKSPNGSLWRKALGGSWTEVDAPASTSIGALGFI